jgi:fibronectin type 3 domain-containing protein
MKKRFFLGMAGIVLAFLTVLSGCDNPTTDIPAKELKPLTLSAPTEVRAIAYEGLNIITWKPVSNAYGYRVYRQDRSSTKESLGVKPVELEAAGFGADSDLNTSLELYYVDTVSFKNQLVNDHDYVYYVEAVSGISTTPGRAVGDWDPSQIQEGGSLADAFVNNSDLAASNTIRAIVPERNGTYDWIAVENVKVEMAYTEPKSIVVTWDAKPNLNYAVTYTWGVGAEIGIDRDSLADTDQTATTEYDYSPFNNVGYTVLPAVGGTNSITVYAAFAGGDAYFNKVAGVSANAVYPEGLAAPTDFKVSRAANSWGELEWKKVDDAEDYAVYRAERVNSYVDTLKSDWAVVTGSYKLNGDKTGYILYDTTAALDKAYRYMLVAVKGTGETAIRSLPATKTLDAGSILAARPDAPDKFAAKWTNKTDVAISWDLDTTAEGLTYKLYRGAATFKNDETGVIANLTSYDYTTETAITVTADNYVIDSDEKVVVLDTPPAPPAGKVWIYRVIAQQYGYDSTSSFAAIGLLSDPGVQSFTVAPHVLNAAQAYIRWTIADAALYDAKYTLQKAKILLPDATTAGSLDIDDIEALGPYVSAVTTDGVIAPASYKEGKAVLVDALSNLTTRSRWLYRLKVEKDGLESDYHYVILQSSAFVATTGAVLSNENTTSELYPTNLGNNTAYQAANTIRLGLNLGSAYLDDNPAIKVYRREFDEPETAYVAVSTTFTATAGVSQLWTDTNVDYNKKYAYKVVVENADGSIRFTNTTSGGGVLDDIRPTYATSVGTLSLGTSAGTGQQRINVSPGAYIENLSIYYRIRATGSTANFADITWRDAVISRTSTGLGTTASPYVYTYSFNITGLAVGTNYELQYYLNIPESVTVPGDTTTGFLFTSP